MLLNKILPIKYPIIQAGMVWVSGAKLAAAAANAGILGVIGAGSMTPELLREHILKAKSLTKNPFAINIPLFHHYTPMQIEVALELGIKIFITSAGSPKTYTKMLKEKGAIVGHVISHPDFAIKCEEAGVDFLVAEGFEAGGHNGRDEITTLTLIPQVLKVTKLPVIAAGGIASGRAMAAMFAMGCSGVQMGTRFVNAAESSAHENFKQAIIKANASDTKLMMKKLMPVRLLKNKFYQEVAALEEQCADATQLQAHLGKGRAKLGMHLGDMDNGELEIGQISAMIDDCPSVEEIVSSIISEYNQSIKKMRPL